MVKVEDEYFITKYEEARVKLVKPSLKEWASQVTHLFPEWKDSFQSMVAEDMDRIYREPD